MTEKLQVYKCEACGNVVEVLHAAGGTLACCDQAMKMYEANSTDAATEKHVPVVAKDGSTVTVTVGSVPHPMADDHYIEWIELLVGSAVYRVDLSPGDEPEATFEGVNVDSVSARAYCNKHGLWKS